MEVVPTEESALKPGGVSADYRLPSLNRAIAPAFGELGACVVRGHTWVFPPTRSLNIDKGRASLCQGYSRPNSRRVSRHLIDKPHPGGTALDYPSHPVVG